MEDADYLIFDISHIICLFVASYLKNIGRSETDIVIVSWTFGSKTSGKEYSKSG